MKNKIENWLLNVALGKFAARLALVIVSYAAGPAIQGLAAKIGIHGLTIDKAELQAYILAGALGAFEWFKARRAKNPNSPAVQTDATKPGGTIAAADVVVP